MDRKSSSMMFDPIITTDVDDLVEEEENDQLLATKTWRDELFLRFRPIVNEDTALEYFCNRSNPFYSKKSVNETLRMQQTGGIIDRNALLESTEGIRYSVDSKRSKPPSLFIIKKEKVEKKDRNAPKLLNLYYIAAEAGVVYQSPSVYDVIQARSFNSLSLLNQTFKEIQPHVEYTTNDVTVLSSPLAKKDGNKSEEEDRFVVANLPPYSVEMQNHVSRLIDLLDIDTNTLIQNKQNKNAFQIQPSIDPNYQQPATIKEEH
ncbi:hypothetical protein NAEGRDRAFT_61462 [Naegleria gruberi]|uniref:Mediator of RNA polymerase II transcription subunit 6 n=1 Tax=Naegleria gruberi TaxID=5762 RepID=D2UYG4_NAEGR|nr:uncharacterized protein NAEGRDRAFT_61462 [Naegleria gruberi]EFC50470.1 hypothetical protein NAEGRDRAFT_61462 [Naegleria gruberi]|eukprot:XP_002683214.1 hypothetical protein NAEGRDRAFT_61462 [Naegleria gruberi strain NEG-M]